MSALGVDRAMFSVGFDRTAEQRLYGVAKAPDRTVVCGGDVELVSLRGCDVDYEQRLPLKPHHRLQQQQQQRLSVGQ